MMVGNTPLILLLLLCYSFLSATNAATYEDAECGLWYAPSSIPNAGIGVYAGKTYKEREVLTSSENVIVPMIDVDEHHDHRNWHNMWYRFYSWASDHVHMELEGLVVRGNSMNFVSAVNCHVDYHTIEELPGPKTSLSGLHRSRDPGAGAFTPYYDQLSRTTQRIEAGEELFTSYGGDWWFLERRDELGILPVTDDYKVANSLVQAWDRLRGNIHSPSNSSKMMMHELLETFVWDSPFFDKSAALMAVPKTREDIELGLRLGDTRELKKANSKRSLDWVTANGVCADHIRGDVSTIPQAGRGAFAKRRLSRQSIVTPLPVLFVADRMRFEMYYNVTVRPGSNETIEVTSYQLALNYCFGHDDSTLLLCPYTMGLINHGGNGTYNAELRWSDPARSNHHPEWLNLTVEELHVQKKMPGLSFDVVALRDIEEGEEILLDYGMEWEEAWTQHVDSWEPSSRADEYVSADEMNSDTDMILRTEFEQIEEPYPENVMLRLDTMLAGYPGYHYVEDCEILRWRRDNEGRILYSGVIVYDNPKGEQENTPFTDVSRDAFHFADLPYTADFHLAGAFRHTMGMPERLFPDKWKNKLGAVSDSLEASEAEGIQMDEKDCRTVKGQRPVRC